MNYAVALNIPRSQPFTYAGEDGIAVGSRVLVPLGRRIVTGTVTEGGVESVKGMKQIVEVLDDEPAFSPSMLRFTKWMGEYYLCSWGEVLDAALPTGLTPTSVFYVKITADVTDEELTAMERRAPKRTELLAYLRDTAGPLRIDQLQKEFPTASISHQLDALQRMGWIEITTEMERERGPRTVRAVRIATDLVKDEARIKATFDELDKRAPKRSLALGHLFVAHHQQQPPIPIVTLAADLGVSTAVIDGLIEKGLAECVEITRPSDEDPFDVSLVSRDETSLELTAEQRDAVEQLSSQTDTFNVTLLEGVTGSGKTVVYQRLMQHVVRSGKTCLVLVPEIALTPQLHDRFKAVFGNEVALLHSRMAIGERIDTWRKIHRGEYRVVIGARSAVFAPLQNMGVIIVDEEHEPSYKQDDPSPRYQGRDAAIMRAHLEGCPVVLGSATPSLESLYNANTGRYRHLKLTHRADRATMPSMVYIDMRAERKRGTVHGTLSQSLVEAIEERVQRKEGVILFLNRRGYASSLQCDDCGATPQCPNCDVSLTWHKATHLLKCHYCGHSERKTMACTTCGSIELHESGVGTQRVEEDLREVFAGKGIVIERMDTDTMKRRHAHRTMLQRFADGTIDVIIGTQMVAKGLDISRVTLVGIINADQALFQSDFRAAERTAQLITQVAGRAGRTAEHPGTVIIQTSNPDHPAVAVAPDFLDREMEIRRETSYPPFTRFITLELSAAEDADVEHASRIFDRLLPTDHPSMVRFPPVPPSIVRLRNRYRRIIVIKNPKAVDPTGSICRSILTSALATYYEHHAVGGVRVTVDVDASAVV